MPTANDGPASAAHLEPAELAAGLDAVLRFGILFLRNGTASFRVREAMRELAVPLGIERLDAQLTLNGIVATAASGPHRCTLVRENVTMAINVDRLGALDALARTVGPRTTAPALNAMLDRIEAQPPHHSLAATAVAVGLACGAFSYLNGGGMVEFLAASVGAALGQALRSLLLRRRVNQFLVTALCAVVAATLYYLAVGAMVGSGYAAPNHQAGLISSVLFLVPGFPLVTSLLDMIQFGFTSSVSRIAYSLMLLLAGAVGACSVAAIAGLTVVAAAPPATPELVTLGLRGAASFLGGVGFAVLYNSTYRDAAVIGLLTMVGNSLRLGLHDTGLGLAFATFLGAFVVGLLATLASPHLRKPRIALTVPGVIVMIPGALAYDTLILFNQGDMLAAMRGAALAGFVVGAMAMGLALARIVSDRRWAFES